MKKLLLILTVLFTTLSINAKCDWSTLKVQQWNQINLYKWYATGAGIGDDTCIGWMYRVYDYQLKKYDTIKDYKGYVEIQFNVKGKYRLELQLINVCENCDTIINREVEIIKFPNANLDWKINNNDCKQYTFTMNYIDGYPLKDTCMEYYMVFYSGPWINKLPQNEWDSLTPYQIFMEYDFPDADLLGYTDTRVASFTFEDTGRVLMYAQWYNKCVGQDTFMFRQLEICKQRNTSSVTRFVNPTKKLLGVYDLLGRPVYHIRENEILIFLYNDGTKEKRITQ